MVAATPDRASVADRVRVTEPFVQPAGVPVSVLAGGVRSMRTAGALVAVVDRPAPLVAVALLVSPSPSPVMRVSAGASAMPDSGSEAVQCTGTSLRYQP